MLKTFKKFNMSSRLKRYLLIGLIVYVFELIIIFLATHFGTNSTIAVGLSFWLGLGLSFVLQKFITFQDKRLQRKIILKQLLATVALVLWNFIFTLDVTRLLQAHLPASVCRSIALAITAVWNYYLYKTSIFKQNDDTILL